MYFHSSLADVLSDSRRDTVKEGKMLYKGKPIVKECDVAVIGGGIAACFAAIKAREAGANKVIMIDKGWVGKSGCSCFGAGAIQTVSPEDDLDWALKEVVESSDYIVDQERLRDHLAEIWNLILEMQTYGVEWEKTPDGKIDLRLGRGRIRHVSFYGPKMMDVMGKTTLRKGIEQINKTMMTDLLTADGRCIGVLAFNTMNGNLYVVKAKATVLASGFSWYKARQPMHRTCTGDGIVAAYRAGTDITDLDCSGHRNLFPALYDIGPGMNMWAGAGGVFRNAQGERFVPKYNPAMKDQAYLGYLSAYLAFETRRGNGPIYMDMTHLPPEAVRRFRQVLPISTRAYERVGIIKGDRFVKLIEWDSTAPMARGGPQVNRRMETCLPGLYGSGDTIPQAGQVVGGQYNIPGAMTSGARAGKFAAEYAQGMSALKIDEGQVEELRKQTFAPMEREDGIEPDQVLLAVQETIVPYQVFLLKEEGRMKDALREIEDIRDNQVPLLYASDPHYLRMAIEARNQVTIAEAQLRSALLRKETRLKCLREGYPYTDNDNWLKWVSVKMADGNMKEFTQDVPIERYPLKPPKGRALHRTWEAAEKVGAIKIEGDRVIWA